jgi:2-polyprenyl-3-methyl-5-hydroxy-6-metoxy-1,4-benzoquinol methylase
MCICCDSTTEELVVIKNGYKITRCLNCNLLYVKDGLPIGEIKKFYSSDYFSRKLNDGIGYSDYLRDERGHRLNSAALLEKINKIKQPGNLLDIGCGYGFFLDEAAKRGWNAFGTDISEEACSYAKGSLGVKVCNCDLLDCGFESGFFDVISLLGSIEHLPNPYKVLEEASRILKNDGIVIITTLNIEGFTKLFKLFKYKPPEHLFYFSRKNIRLLLNKTGLSPMQMGVYYKYYALYDLTRRIEEFSGCRRKFLSNGVKKIKLSESLVKIPTNEMLVLAGKNTGSDS